MYSTKKFAIGILLCMLLFPAMIARPNTSLKSPNDKEELVELEIKNIKPYYDNSYLVELTKKGANENWVLPMIIGGCEAVALERARNNTSFPRPLTYDLFISIFKQTGLSLKHIVITKLQDETFYAVLVLEENGKSIEIDARPSDCINIAMKAKVPIYATQAVLDAAKEEGR